MPPELSKNGGLIAGLCLAALLWGLSIGAVYWDLKRRYLSSAEELAWLALVALLPGLGLLAYLFSRLLGRAFPLSAGGRPAGGGRRATLLKQLPEAAPRTGTIAASDLVTSTVLNRPAVPVMKAAPVENPPIAATPPDNTPKATPIFQAPPTVERPGAIVLAIVSGPQAGQELWVEALPARIGRGGEAGLRLDRDLGVSRLHSELYRQEGRLHIRDLGSSHGTLVNGVSIHDKVLQVGDTIEVGHSTLVVRGLGA
jgi:hypothetical protein